MTSNYSASIEQPTVSNSRAILGVSHLFSQSSSQRLNPTFNFKGSSQTGFDPVKATSGGRDAIAPKAKLVKANITTPGSTYTFKVIYTDQGGIKKTTINSKDILVSGPGGFRKLANRVGLTSNRSATRVVATYRMAAVGGTWDATDNGLYTISMQRKQVSDKQGNFVKSGKLGNFAVTLPASPSPSPGPSPVPGPSPSPGPSPNPTPTDGILPTATLSFSQVTAGTKATSFTVTYSDNVAINTASIDSSDILVTGVNGFSQTASLIAVDNLSNGATRTATYQIAAPGGSWNATDSGAYTITLQANQVKDTNGNFAASSALGTFNVNIFAGGVSNSPINGSNTTEAIDYSALSSGILLNLNKGPIFGSLASPKIMPLGDSITAGEHTTNPVPGAYRIQLYQDFSGDGFSIDFVGSQANGPNSNFDRDHEGHPGWRIDEITGLIDNPGFLTSYNPDVVLLMIGTNDTNGTNNRSLSQMKTDLSTLIDEIVSRLPNTELVVSSVAPTQDSNRRQRLQAYNAEIPGIVTTKQKEGKKVGFVDAGGRLSVSDLTTDGIHPTAAGYNKLGNLWYDAIAPDVVNNIEDVVGTTFNDTIIGTSGNNVINGSGGSDRLTGGGGVDTFVYTSFNDGGDVITDFTNSDFIQISASGFGGGLVAGIGLAAGVASATGTFVNGNTPVGTGATFLYSGGVLSFDADGTGAGAAIEIATLSGSPSLTASQFSIVA
ncbi:MAG TPA: GDSL-type esterase/lipase family protein [Crinalium sp.]